MECCSLTCLCHTLVGITPNPAGAAEPPGGSAAPGARGRMQFPGCPAVRGKAGELHPSCFLHHSGFLHPAARVWSIPWHKSVTPRRVTLRLTGCLGAVREYQLFIRTHPILRLEAPVHSKGDYPLRVGSSGSGVLPEGLHRGRRSLL